MIADTGTIFAVASGSGRAAIAVMRITGSATPEILHALTAGSVPRPRQAGLRRLRADDGTILDQAMVLWMPGPASYTGEDTAELYLHGGVAVLDGVAEALIKLGARPADPGAFTRRAFLNGKMELTGAEAVADLIDAETATQRAQALRQLDGNLGKLFDSWALRLRRLLAEQEALIDFPDDLDAFSPLAAPVEALIAEIEGSVAESRGGERLRDGLRFAIVGPPNAGKSTLVNALAGRDAAIVSPIPGTTRDVIEVRTIFGDVPVVLLDTAGLRSSDDPVEAEGVRRAEASAAAADLVIALCAADQSVLYDSFPADLQITTKIDVAAAWPDTLGISVHTGDGLIALRAQLDHEAHRLTSSSGPPSLTRSRHRAACVDAANRLRASIAALSPELRAEELRLAMQALGRVTGKIGVEHILDSVFSQFCIGK